jgi:glutamine amidotransferase
VSEISAKRVVGIVDYQAGNIQSIENAFAQIGATVLRVRSGAELKSCTHLVLPGVGAFGFCAERLQASGMVDDLRQWAFEQRRSLLGICVGMQLLGDSSEESPNMPGLGWVGGPIRRLRGGPGIRVPHVGWNSVRFENAYGSFAAGDAADFYFDHSFAYHDPRSGRTVGFCQHGERFSAIIEAENITAVQFHPEKSQASGLKLLRGFLSR